MVELSPRRLRIAQVAPLFESVPPKCYGGTERVVAWLCEALEARGHQITLFATGDSTSSVPLRSVYPHALRQEGLEQLGPAYELAELSQVYEHAEEFDLIHAHVDFWAFPFARLVDTPTLTTLHYRVDLPETLPIYRQYSDLPLVSISDAQRRGLPGLNWVGTVYHGLPVDQFDFNPRPGRYLAFLGRLSRDKRPDLAILAARRAGIPLKIAAKIGADDRAYYEAVVKPLITPPDVEYIGEISDREKGEFLGSALALVFPVDWPEPFGLVMIESLACGTPVIARPRGSVAEIIRPGVTGLFADELDEFVQAMQHVEQLSRPACRLEFEHRFTSDLMAKHYEELYRTLLAQRRHGQATTSARRRPHWTRPRPHLRRSPHGL